MITIDYEIKNVTNECELEKVIAFISDNFPSHNDVCHDKMWNDRLKNYPELMLFAELENKIIATVLAFLESNGNMTIDFVATDESHRRKGIARKMMLLIERQAKTLGVQLIALGSTESAEVFYTKLGYIGQTLIQSKQHTIEELLNMNPGYPGKRKIMHTSIK